MHAVGRVSIFIFLACLGTACENDPAEVNALSRKVVEVEEGRNISALFSQEANLKAYLTAPLMKRVRADTSYAEFPNSLRVEFYKPEGGLQNVVTANYARYFENQGKVFLRDSVVVYNLQGDTLFCQTLWWNQNEENFHTDDAVRIHTRTQVLAGTGLDARSDFSRYQILNTSGTVLLPAQNDSTPAPLLQQ